VIGRRDNSESNKKLVKPCIFVLRFLLSSFHTKFMPTLMLPAPAFTTSIKDSVLQQMRISRMQNVMHLTDGYNSMQPIPINHGLELIGVAVMMELYFISRFANLKHACCLHSDCGTADELTGHAWGHCKARDSYCEDDNWSTEPTDCPDAPPGTYLPTCE